MFSNIDKHDQEQTEIIDEVEFENPYGILTLCIHSTPETIRLRS